MDPGNVRWSRLVYQASAFFITMESEIRQGSIPVADVLPQLVLNNEPNVVRPKFEKILKVENYSEGFGKKTRYSLWFDQNGEALQRKKLVRGKKNEIKIYRFTPCGHYTLRKKFSDKKFDENYSQWKESDRSYTDFNSNLCGNEQIYDVNSLLYLISALNIKDVGYKKDFLTFSYGHLVRVKLTAKKMSTVYADYKIKSPDRDLTVNESVDVLELHLTPVTEDKKERENFRFLGLKGDVTVYLDLKHQLILRLRGKVDVVGSLDINLKRAELVN